jgi:hypothetical protein
MWPTPWPNCTFPLPSNKIGRISLQACQINLAGFILVIQADLLISFAGQKQQWQQ